MMSRSFAAIAALPLLFACGNKNGGDASSATASAAATSPAGSSQPAAASSAAKTDAPAADSVAALRERASAVMDALKKGDAKAAAEFCSPKMRESFQKFIEESFKENGGRPDAYKSWNGKLGEIRIDGKSARVQIGEWSNGPRVVYLLFWQKDGEWRLGDIPLELKSNWDKWGQVAN